MVSFIVFWFVLVYIDLFHISLFKKSSNLSLLKKLWFLSADVVRLWLLKNYPFSAVFQLWELVLLFFSQVLLNIYLPNEVIPSTYKPAVAGGSAVLCIMFVITAARRVSNRSKVWQDHSKSLSIMFCTFQSTVAEIKWEVSGIWVEGIICWVSDYIC